MKNYKKGFIISLLLIAFIAYIYVNQQAKTSVTKYTENIIATTSNSIIDTQNSSNSISNENTNHQTLFNYANSDYIEKYDDFNFDGLIDKVSVDENSNDAYRGFPNKSIYVQTNSGNYVLSSELSQLINGVGYFYVDKVKKTITTYGAGSCCTHYGSKYIVVPDIGLKEVYRISEESGSYGDVPEDKIKVTTESLMNYNFTDEKIRDGKWQKEIKILDLKNYKYFDSFIN